MVCGQIHALATLLNYVRMHLMNKALRRQPAILETRYVYFTMLCNRGPSIAFSCYVSSVGNTVTIPWTKPHLICQACCLQECLNNGVFCSRMFLLYTPLKYDHIPYLISLLIYGTPFPGRNKSNHCVTVARDLTTSTKMD